MKSPTLQDEIEKILREGGVDNPEQTAKAVAALMEKEGECGFAECAKNEHKSPAESEADATHVARDSKSIPPTKAPCTCASFFTVRGAHKPDCPQHTESSPRKCRCGEVDLGGDKWKVVNGRVHKNYLPCQTNGDVAPNPPTSEWESELSQIMAHTFTIPQIKEFIARLITSERESFEALHEKHTKEMYALGKTHGVTETTSKIISLITDFKTKIEKEL